MFDHVGVRVSDRARSDEFYGAVLEAIGAAPTHVGPRYSEWDEFALGDLSEGHALTQHLHLAFVAESREDVDAFHAAGLALGAQSAGEPGERPQYKPDYYGAFLLDPDGNSVEAVHHAEVRRGGHLDHLWIGVADVARATAFYDAISPHTGLRRGQAWEGAQQFVGAWATMVLVADGRPPTTGLHLAFSAPDQKTVHGFHAAALAAGGSDHGAPGERPEYHPGYYAAYALDLDGINVESVHHG